MIPSAFGALLAVIAWFIHRYRTGMSISPDGTYYLKAAAKQPVPSPYSRRWLLPFLLGTKVRRWEVSTFISFLCASACLSSWLGFWASFFLVFSTGLGALNVRLPVLVDMPAFALSVAAAFSAAHGHVWLAVCLSVLAGACAEKAPVFIALWSWNAWCLLGLVGARWIGRTAEPDQPWLKSPFQSARDSRDILGWKRMLLPWGGVVVAIPFVDIRALAAIAVAYGQCLIAMDDSRLYQWAMPAVLAALFQNHHLSPSVLNAILSSAAVFHIAVLGAHRGT
jgi:hypothetical protein